MILSVILYTLVFHIQPVQRRIRMNWNVRAFKTTNISSALQEAHLHIYYIVQQQTADCISIRMSQRVSSIAVKNGSVVKEPSEILGAFRL